MGFAADTLLETAGSLRSSEPEAAPFEFRELSFSGGAGSDAHLTIPYFLKHFNGSLTGFGTHRTLPQLPSTGYTSEGKNGLNVALSNAHSWQLSQEVEELKKVTATIPDFDQRWKLLTIMIGANDLCDGMGTGFEACNGNAADATALVNRYESRLRSTLEAIRDSMQRIVVQLVSMFSVASVPKARAGSWYCDLRRRVVNECNCLDRLAGGKSGAADQKQLLAFEATTEDLNNRIHKLSLEFNLQRSDFAVINAVSTKGQAIPDISYLSGLDCFHPSAKAHGAVARALWNSLFQMDRVPAPLNASASLFCPTEETVIHVGSRTPSSLVV